MSRIRISRPARPAALVSQLTNRQSSSFRLTGGQEGFTLAALIVLLTIITLVIAYTVPEQWSLVMRRERERQTIFLMKQYARSIMEFQKKHQAPPTSLKQLQDARNPRMIRGGGDWPCPLTGKEGDWILVPQTAILPPGVPGMPQGGSGLPPAGAPAGTAPTPATGTAPVPGAGAPVDPNQPLVGGSRLNPAASPPDYEGPFIAVRPRASGPSLIVFNEAEDYSEWVYTAGDLTSEIQARMTALTAR
jgi:type II secretory pathway pseudopilin PulG